MKKIIDILYDQPTGMGQHQISKNVENIQKQLGTSIRLFLKDII